MYVVQTYDVRVASRRSPGEATPHLGLFTAPHHIIGSNRVPVVPVPEILNFFGPACFCKNRVYLFNDVTSLTFERNNDVIRLAPSTKDSFQSVLTSKCKQRTDKSIHPKQIPKHRDIVTLVISRDLTFVIFPK